MALESVPAGLLLVVMIVAMSMITVSMRRFIEGDFKRILHWLRNCLWFTTIGYGIFVVREFGAVSGSLGDILIWVIYACMLVVGFCILKAAMLINAFTKSYGFATMMDQLVVKKKRR